MTTVARALSALFEEHGWVVEMPPPEALAGGDFDLVAENDVAVVFVASTARPDLQRNSGRLSGAIAAALQRQGGAKMWEAYLVLLVPGLQPSDDETISEVQRDLGYCRKLVVNLDAVLGAEDPVEVLLRRLALLFPLSLADSVEGPNPAALLERGLVDRGNDLELVRGLLAAVHDPSFDPLAYFAGRVNPK